VFEKALTETANLGRIKEHDPDERVAPSEIDE
jgi:hypothetical protein